MRKSTKIFWGWLLVIVSTLYFLLWGLQYEGVINLENQIKSFNGWGFVGATMLGFVGNYILWRN